MALKLSAALIVSIPRSLHNVAKYVFWSALFASPSPRPTRNLSKGGGNAYAWGRALLMVAAIAAIIIVLVALEILLFQRRQPPYQHQVETAL